MCVYVCVCNLLRYKTPVQSSPFWMEFLVDHQDMIRKIYNVH